MNLSTAQTQYYSRPKDERYSSLQEMIATATHDRQRSAEKAYNWRDLQWTPTVDQATGTAGLQLASPKGAANLTHWSFGQACTMLGAPAGFLRQGVTPKIAADVLNHRITKQEFGAAPHLLIQAPNGNPHATVRAITSTTYKRIWDDTLYTALQSRLGHQWTAPPVWEGGTGGIYRGDRDSFALLIEGGSIVTDPSAAAGNGPMYRGLLVKNSEVGASAVKIDCVLDRYVCGNHMLWGAVINRTFSRRHVGENAVRDTMREINQIARAWTDRSASQDEAIIRQLLDLELAHTEAAVIDELQAIGYTKADAKAAYDRCVTTENASPRSSWGIAQGTTRLSQDSGYQDERYELDQLAAKVLARGRKLVAA